MPEGRADHGTVYLVGWGPGEADLATVRARELVRWAPRLFVHGEVTRDGLLERAGDAESLDDPAQLVAAAQKGGSVVALYPGDPLLDGEAGRHAALLAAEGIDLEIVPGVSRALWAAAAAGTLPPRAVHLQVEGGEGAARLTLSTSSGRTLETLRHELLQAGHHSTTPALLVEEAGTPDQRRRTGSLAEVTAQGEPPPSTRSFLVAGVAAKHPLDWLERRPLHGLGVVTTRPAAQSAGLSAALRAAGARVVEFPTIATVPVEDLGPVDAAITSLGDRHWVIFTSANGVEAFFHRMRAVGRDARAFGAARVAAIGPATAEALAGHGIRADVIPHRYQAEGLLEALGNLPTGARILIPRAAVARDVLPATLRARGCQVDVVPVYRTVQPPADVEGLLRSLEERRIQAITFTSSSTVRHFCDLLAGEEVGSLLRKAGVVVACIGPITAGTARGLGVEVEVEASTFTVPGLVAALAAHFRGRPG